MSLAALLLRLIVRACLVSSIAGVPALFAPVSVFFTHAVFVTHVLAYFFFLNRNCTLDYSSVRHARIELCSV